jgi:hypothetical protein
VMFRVRRADKFEMGDLNVFVPGLMAAGILASMAMLIADGAKKLWPSRGHRARVIELDRRAAGRVRDLESVGLGIAPVPKRVDRIPRNSIASSAIAFASLTVALGIARATIGMYTARTGELAGRGWTLSVGLGLAAAIAIFGSVALLLALTRGRARRPWLLIAAQRWPLGQLPQPRPEEAA